MSDCQEFFSLNPKDRWEGSGKRKICFSCLKPRDVCKGGRCIFSSTIPEELICQGCKPRAEQKGWATLNILYCRSGAHASTRAPVTQIKKQFEKYLGKLSSDINDKNLKISVESHDILKRYCDKRGIKIYKFIENLIIETCTEKKDIYGES